MSVVKYKDPSSGQWLPVPALKVLTEGGSPGEWDTTGIPADIVAEAERVISSISSKIGKNAITFIAMSDAHEPGPGETVYSDGTNVTEEIKKGNRNAGQGARLISQKIPLDFFAHLGDMAWGSGTTSVIDGVSSIRKVREHIAEVVMNNESFITPGNHDSLSYGSTTAGEFLNYDMLTALTGTYRYKDFDSKKVRVICLNTADNSVNTTTHECISGEQLQWFCEALDLSAKSDAAKWGIVILSHHPLDWADIRTAGNVIGAYLDGASFTANHNGVTVSYNFSGKNAAKIIAQFHGHTHNFNVDYIHDFRTGTAAATTVKRIAIPNSCYSRNNTYGNSEPDYYGIDFGEQDANGNRINYNKVDNSTGKNTAFCVVTIDLDEKIVCADCFGAGRDRVVSYGEKEIITYSVTNNLSHAKNSNGATIITEGASYSAVITPNDGYTLDSVTATMGGVSVPVENGTINIQSVTGDIVITATTIKNAPVYNVTNLVPTALAADGSVYNGTGYKDDTYISSGGAYSADAASGCVATGFIHYKPGDVIYIRGGTLSNAGRARLYIQESISSASAVALFGSSGFTEIAWTVTGNSGTIVFTIEKLGDQYYKLTPNDALTAAIDADDVYRLSLYGKGEDLIITHNEPIE